MKVAAFIQARMGSSRLPGKVLAKLGGIEALGHVVARTNASGVDETFVLTTLSPLDLPIVRYCAEHGVRVSCGSENDVLDRYWQTARLVDAEHVLRITADCPILDPRIVREVVDLHLSSGADYTSNTLPECYPDGLDCEIFRGTVLERAWREARLPSEREHVTPYMKKNPGLFRLVSLKSPENLNHMRWTLDTPDDLEFLSRIFQELGTGIFGMDEVLSLLRKRPELESINGGQIRNEGYLKSLGEDARRGN
jgi:spore coat polysaccharide biosynthesis protein SpsF (cytidylyltransferase family)